MKHYARNIGLLFISLISACDSSDGSSETKSGDMNPQYYPIAKINSKTKFNNKVQTKVGDVNWFSAEGSTAANGQLLTYLWALSSKPALSNSTFGDDGKVKSYLITDVAGIYEVMLTVTNTVNQLTATKVLPVHAEELLVNSQPVAVINPILSSYSINQTVKLNASSSYDTDGAQLNYLWKIKSPEHEQSILQVGESAEFIEFVVENIGDYQITLEVSDGMLSDEQSINITVTSDNIPPVANAGEDKVSYLGISLELDGSASSDIEGDNLQYQWSVVSKPVTSEYERTNGFNDYHDFSFMADITGEYILALQVFDGINYSAADQVHIEVVENQKPLALLPDDFAIQTQGTQLITGIDSFDPEGVPLVYSWQIINKPEGSTATSIPLNERPTTQFTVDIPGTYTLQLIVNDGFKDSLPATMSIVYTDEEWHEVNVIGQLVYDSGLPASMVSIGGILQPKITSDENGYFNVLLRSKERDAALTTLYFHIEEDLTALLRLEETDSSTLELGKIKVPILQRKDIALTACSGYNGAEKIETSFYLTPTGYDERMSFPKSIKITLTVGAEPITKRLPATGIIKTFLNSSITDKVYASDNNSHFSHLYQIDDSKEDLLTLTVCN